MRYSTNYLHPSMDWGGALTGASTGFKMGSSVGMIFGPVGGAITGGIGALTGALFGNRAENKRAREQRRQDVIMNKTKLDEKNRALAMSAKQTKLNDTNELNNFSMSNKNSLFIGKGGWIGKASRSIKRRGTKGKCTPMSKPGCTGRALALAKTFHKMAKNRAEGGPVLGNKLAEKGAKEYRDNIAKFDSLRTILRPELFKSGKDHLKSQDIKRILGDKGHKIYNDVSDYLSNAYSVNPKLKVSMNEFKGSLENPNNKLAGYLYGKKINEHKFPNAEFNITDKNTGKVDTTIYAYPKGTIKPDYMKGNGGKIVSNGRMLTGGNKLLTKNGSVSGSHESGANIPIKRNNKTVAIAEPGEVLVIDKDITSTPFVLSKRLGFAQKFMELEGMKNMHNASIIEGEQSKLVSMNNKMVRKSKYAGNGVPIPRINNVSNFSLTKVSGLQKTNNLYKSSDAKRAGNIFGDIRNKLPGLDMNTIAGAAGTIGNLLMSNKTLKRQKGLVQNSLNEALAYTPRLNKNYLLNDNVDINDQVSGINQGYSSVTSGLSGIDPAIASALKNSANLSRTKSLGSVFANRNNIQSGIRNQNTMNIMQNNASNNDTLNQTALMKLNAKISANEQLGEAENARLGNVQGAISEFNTILRDKDIMKSLDARWKDSIGKDYTGKAYGGRLGKKRKHAMAR